MSDDPVKQSIAELQDLVRCRCHPAYTGRGLHDPDCECDSAEAVQVVADRIEELQAKLAKALDGLHEAESAPEPDRHVPEFRHVMDIIGSILAELKRKPS
jgi:hypothetical protein